MLLLLLNLLFLSAYAATCGDIPGLSAGSTVVRTQADLGTIPAGGEVCVYGPSGSTGIDYSFNIDADTGGDTYQVAYGAVPASITGGSCQNYVDYNAFPPQSGWNCGDGPCSATFSPRYQNLGTTWKAAIKVRCTNSVFSCSFDASTLTMTQCNGNGGNCAIACANCGSCPGANCFYSNGGCTLASLNGNQYCRGTVPGAPCGSVAGCGCSASPPTTAATTAGPTSVPTCSGGVCCNCNCCAGAGCSPAVRVGSVTVSACSQCDASLCSANFPASCPTTNSLRQASCSSSGSPSTSPGGTTVTYVTYDAVGCNGNIVAQGSAALTDNLCIPTTAFGSTIKSLKAVGLAGNTGTLTLCSSTDCSTGCSSTTVTSGVCADSATLGGSGRFAWTPTGGGGSGAAPCFHKDTIITYAGKDHTFDEIRAHPECSIPHVVQARGVVITAKCSDGQKTLRLTNGHLVSTQRGLQAAIDLKPGKDVLYSDINQSKMCQIVSVTKETEQHEYFGLNCLTSEVLASGLKSSTFEKLHSVPAFWMQIVGQIIGIKRASQAGDYIAELVQKMNLI